MSILRKNTLSALLKFSFDFTNYDPCAGFNFAQGFLQRVDTLYEPRDSNFKILCLVYNIFVGQKG